MDNLTPFTFTSPDTGTEYLVQPISQWRMAGGYLEHCPLYRVDYTEYQILRDGKVVQFCFSEDQIASTVRHLENPYTEAQLAVLSSRYD